jgi:predicted MFS family arabinose efflux permease
LQGVISIIAAPLVGAISDLLKNRTKPVIFCIVLMCVAPLVVVITDNIWAYYICRAIFNWYGPAFSVVVASIVDKFKRSHAEEQEEILRISKESGTNDNEDDDIDAAPHQIAQTADRDVTTSTASIQNETPPTSSGNFNRNQQEQQLTQKNGSRTPLVYETANEEKGEQEQEETMERGQTATQRTGGLSLILLLFVAGMMVGSLIGTAITDNRKKFFVQLGSALFAAIWVSLVGVSHTPVPSAEDDNDAANITQDTEIEEEERTSNEKTRLVGSFSSSQRHRDQDDDDAVSSQRNQHQQQKQKRDEKLDAIDDASKNSQLAHAKTPKEKIMKMLRNKNLMIVCAIVFMDFLAEQALQTLVLLYVKDELGFSSDDQQVLLFVLGAASLVALLVTIRILSHFFSLMTNLRIALSTNAGSVILFGFAAKKWQCFAIPSLASVGMLVFPLMSSVGSFTVIDEDAATGQGFVAAARFLAEGLAPSIFGIFLQKVKSSPYPMPGLPFIVAGACPLVGFALSFLLPDDIGERKKEKK